MNTRFLIALLVTVSAPALLAWASEANAEVEKLPPGVQVVKLAAMPESITLESPFAYRQLLLTATLSTGDQVDVTRIAQVKAPDLVTVTSGLVRPRQEGSGQIVAELDGQSVTIPVSVTGQSASRPISFIRDVEPVLARLGCNSGTCHGAQQGKNGFKLTLRGYDPLYDHRSLTDDLEARRFNRAAPEQSLFLLKTSGAVPHAGGVLTSPGEPYYEMLRQWIAEGARFDKNTSRVSRIEVLPKDPTVPRPGMKQQFVVLATYADGSQRDVTAEAFIESSNTEVATVDRWNRLTAVRRGEATMLARYEGQYAASTVVVMGDRSGFAWSAPPQLNWIDELVDKKLQRMKILPSPMCDDAEFLRRVYLDLTGLPPSPEAVQAFLDDRRESRVKREAVIDSLVGSDAYVEHWTNKWADLLQVNRKFLGDPGAKALRDWIKQAIASNMPYDKFAYTILTASGPNIANPPASYYKVLRTPDAIVENTTHLFLAIRFNCNKCHDHPFERWTQDHYYELAAYFARVELKEDPKYKGQKLGVTAVERQGFPLGEIVGDAAQGEVKHDRTGKVTPPKFPYEVPVEIPSNLSRREQVARWITHPANPYFARSYVNRIWSYLLGVGLIEPVDDIRAGNPPSNPELLDRLTQEFIQSGFDNYQLVKLICKSRTYQLSIATNDWNKDDEVNYSHALPRRLSAEALYDAIHAVTGSVSKLPGLPPGSRAAQLVDSNVELPGGFLELFGKPVRESACECERSSGMNLGPVLAMVNGPIVAEAIKDPNNRIVKILTSVKDDARAVEQLYLAVLARRPTAEELEAGVKALRSADADLAALRQEYQKRVEAFEKYKSELDARQRKWEQDRLALRPTNWVPLEPKVAVATSKAKLTKNADHSILSSSQVEGPETYRVTAEAPLRGITAIRLEVLTDPSLPKKGPGLAQENGNFVLSEFRANSVPLGSDEKARPIRFARAEATFQQAGFGAAQAIDNNPSTGWAVGGGGTGKDQAIMFLMPKATNTPGTAFTFVLEQNYGTRHLIGKFRFSVTADPNPRLTSPLTPEETALLSKPVDQRTEQEKQTLRQRFLAQDEEYQRLARAVADAPPSDPRILGAQDLVWALINSPAFLFNH